jgi:hypothetical protein
MPGKLLDDRLMNAMNAPSAGITAFNRVDHSLRLIYSACV